MIDERPNIHHSVCLQPSLDAHEKPNQPDEGNRSIANTENGQVGSETLFHYHQHGEIVTAEYRGGSIVTGHLIAKILLNGQLDMRYHHLNEKGEFMLGKCISTPELLPDGRLKFRESWQWLCGDFSSGYSEIEEVKNF